MSLSLYTIKSCMQSCPCIQFIILFIVSDEHISNTFDLQLNHQKNICVNFLYTKYQDLFIYTDLTIANSSNSTHTCIQLEESVNTLVDNAYSNNSIDYCITRSISHIPWNYSTSYNSSGFLSVENEKRSEKAVHKSGEKIEIFVGRHSKFSPDRSCVIRQP